MVTVSFCNKEALLFPKKMEVCGAVTCLMYHSQIESYEVFCWLRAAGVKCCHAGSNSPVGAAVIITNDNNIKIEQYEKIYKDRK